MQVIALLTLEDLKKTNFSGFFKFVLVSIDTFYEQKVFMLLGPGNKLVYHRQIIMKFMEENNLTNQKVTTYGGGLLSIVNLYELYHLNELAFDNFKIDRPFLIFSGSSHDFNTASKKYINEALSGNELLRSCFAETAGFSRNILLTREEDLIIKKYTYKKLKEMY